MNVVMAVRLAELLTAAEFTDLIAYLEALRPGGKLKMGAGVIGPISLPRSFDVRTIATGLSGATALEALPDGRVLLCEQTGAVRVIQDGRLLDEPFVTLPVAPLHASVLRAPSSPKAGSKKGAPPG